MTALAVLAALLLSLLWLHRAVRYRLACVRVSDRLRQETA